MSLLERRRVLMQKLEDATEAVGCDGQIVFTQHVNGQGASFSSDFANSFATASLAGTGTNYAPTVYGDKKCLVPNLIQEGSGLDSAEVYLVSAPSYSVAGVTVYGYKILDNTLTYRKRIHTNNVVGINANNKYINAIAVAPEFTKILTCFNTSSAAIDFNTNHPWTGTDVVGWITSSVPAYTASTAYRATYSLVASCSEAEGNNFILDLKTSKDAGLTYCIVGSWLKGSSSFSRDGAHSWSNLTEVLSYTTESTPNSQRYQSSEISIDGKNAVIATEKGLFFSNDYLGTFEFKPYTSVGISDIHLENSGSVRRHINLAASSKLKTIYIWGETKLASGNSINTAEGSIWVSTDYGKTFTKVFSTGSTYPASCHLACSADGKEAMIRFNGNIRFITLDSGTSWLNRGSIIGNNLNTAGNYEARSLTDYYRQYPNHSFAEAVPTINLDAQDKATRVILSVLAENWYRSNRSHPYITSSVRFVLADGSELSSCPLADVSWYSYSWKDTSSRQLNIATDYEIIDFDDPDTPYEFISKITTLDLVSGSRHYSSSTELNLADDLGETDEPSEYVFAYPQLDYKVSEACNSAESVFRRIVNIAYPSQSTSDLVSAFKKIGGMVTNISSSGIKYGIGVEAVEQSGLTYFRVDNTQNNTTTVYTKNVDLYVNGQVEKSIRTSYNRSTGKFACTGSYGTLTYQYDTLDEALTSYVPSVFAYIRPTTSSL